MRQKQKGLTAITWIILLGLIGIQAVMALRIIPVYLNHGTVKTIMDNVASDVDLRGKTAGEIKKILSSRLQVNNIYALQESKDAFKFKKLTDGLQVDLHYERRGPIYGNLEFVATFEYQVVIPRR